MNIPASKPLRGTLTVSGDKSISHRAVMLGSLATGTTEIEGFFARRRLPLHHTLLPQYGRSD